MTHLETDCSQPRGRPCLYDLRADPGEHRDLGAARPDVVAALWTALNASLLTLRDCQGWSYEGVRNAGIPGPAQPGGGTSCSPAALLGPCDQACAQNVWLKGYGNRDGPICNVPGCS